MKYFSNNNTLVQRRIGPYNMILDLSSQGISIPLYQQGYREACFMHLLASQIKPGDTCVDLGSNIGYTTLFMCGATGPEGKVFAIEPDPWNISMLKRNIELNGFLDFCEIHECAISDLDGELDFWLSEKSNLSSVSKTKHSTSSIKVDAYTLGTFMSDKGFPNFIKMDVEGHEVSILRGALEFFKKNEGNVKILLEVHPFAYNDENSMEYILREYFEIGFQNKFTVSTPVAIPKKFEEAGYVPFATAQTDGFERGIYSSLNDDDFIEFSCYEHSEGTSRKIVRSILLEREIGS